MEYVPAHVPSPGTGLGTGQCLSSILCPLKAISITSCIRRSKIVCSECRKWRPDGWWQFDFLFTKPKGKVRETIPLE